MTSAHRSMLKPSVLGENIDFVGLKSTASRIKNDTAKEFMNKFIDKTHSYFEVLNEYLCHNPKDSLLFNDTLKECETFISTCEKESKKWAFRDKILGTAIIKVVLDSIEAHKKIITPEKKQKLVADLQEKNLYLQQNLLCRRDIAEKLKITLNEISELGMKNYSPTQIFIYYTEAKQPYLKWTNDFITNLKKQIQEAGLNSVELLSDTPDGGNVNTHLEKIINYDHVLVIGTEAFLEAQISGKMDVQLGYLRNRENSTKKITPVLISGSFENSFPPYYEFIKSLDWKSDLYLQSLRNLIAFLYRTEENSFKPCWDKFLASLEQDSQDYLTKGYSEEAIAKATDLQEEKPDPKKELAIAKLFSQHRESISSFANINKFLEIDSKKKTDINASITSNASEDNSIVLIAVPGPSSMPILLNSEEKAIISSTSTKELITSLNKDSLPPAPGGPKSTPR